MATTEAMRAIPFTVTTERAAKIFNDWRLSLWYQPPATSHQQHHRTR
jgi:hypothetical protein